MRLALALVAVTCAAQTLDGVVDIHVHADPDSMPRIMDAPQAARMAREAGVRGVLFKSHYEPTASLAYLVRSMVPGLEAFGGVALNRSVGGVNAAAVERMAAVKGGYGKVVWMPTFDAENNIRKAGEARPFVSVSRAGKLLPEVLEVLDVIARRNLVLATGHSTPEENLLLIAEARRRGVRSIVVTHAMLNPVNMTVEQMKEAASLGALLEFVYIPQEVERYAGAIRAIGHEHCIMSSDLGRAGAPLPVDGMRAYMQALARQGFTTDEIAMMSKHNPARLLGLPISSRTSAPRKGRAAEAR